MRTLWYSLPFCVTAVSITAAIFETRQRNILESPKLTDFGFWGPFENCTDGNIVTGFQLKMEEFGRPFDDTALNGVRFFCGSHQENITSSVGLYGEWGNPYFCSEYAIGFQLKSQKYQGPQDDDVAATNMKLICALGESIEGYEYSEQQIYAENEYTGVQICPLGMALCGLQTQQEFPQAFGSKLFVLLGNRRFLDYKQCFHIFIFINDMIDCYMNVTFIVVACLLYFSI